MSPSCKGQLRLQESSLGLGDMKKVTDQRQANVFLIGGGYDIDIDDVDDLDTLPNSLQLQKDIKERADSITALGL